MDLWHILVIIGIIAFIFEIFTAGFISGSIGVGFLFAALGNYLRFETKWQILLFTFGVGLTYFLIKPLITKYGYNKTTASTNQDALLDKKGIVTEEINNIRNNGRVKIDGDDWKAIAENNDIIKVGTTVRVVALDSITLIVKPLNK